MLKWCFLLVAVGHWIGHAEHASAEHFHSNHHSGYRTPGEPYGNPVRSTYQPQYGWYSGRPLYNGGYPGTWWYYGAGYGATNHGKFGGFGANGFPRHTSSGLSGGFRSYLSH